MTNVSDKSCRENQNSHFIFNNFFKTCCLWDKVEKYCTAGEATDDKWVLHNYTEGYKHTQNKLVYNTYCFPTATVVTRTHLTITFIRTLLAFFTLNPVLSTKINSFTNVTTGKVNITVILTAAWWILISSPMTAECQIMHAYERRLT